MHWYDIFRYVESIFLGIVRLSMERPTRMAFRYDFLTRAILNRKRSMSPFAIQYTMPSRLRGFSSFSKRSTLNAEPDRSVISGRNIITKTGIEYDYKPCFIFNLNLRAFAGLRRRLKFEKQNDTSQAQRPFWQLFALSAYMKHVISSSAIRRHTWTGTDTKQCFSNLTNILFLTRLMQYMTFYQYSDLALWITVRVTARLGNPSIRRMDASLRNTADPGGPIDWRPHTFKRYRFSWYKYIFFRILSSSLTDTLWPSQFQLPSRSNEAIVQI